MGRLDGKVAIVTGGARGQGEAEVRLFVAEGANVVVSDVLVEAGEEVAASLGENAVFLRHDVSREDHWEAAINLANESFGGLDILVNNAGILHSATIANHTLADYERVVAVNQVGVFLGTRAAIAPMTSGGGGSIVNISSGAGLRATKYNFAYAATKYAVTGMTAASALELARNRIRVNSIHPGVIDTPMVASGDDDVFERHVQHTPMRPHGEPEEIARVALFLASDESSYMTGAHVPVDGGVTV
jgi:3alpha(or 20beta)-hydroxysteroid dehydrogenase